MNSVYFATGNMAKFEEAQSFIGQQLPDLNFERIDADIPEIQGPNAELILRNKAKAAASITARPVLVDDASFDTERYPGFPGSYANFLDETIGLDGWKKLFKEGDRIKAVSRVGLVYLGELQVFSGQIDGVISFKDLEPHNSSITLGNLMLLEGDNVTLCEALRNPQIATHRKRALAQLCIWISEQHEKARKEQGAINQRWDQRSTSWEGIIDDPSSYVNYENNYGRMNDLIKRIVPLANADLLEIGCGTGEAGRIAYDANPALEVVAIDASKGMIEQAELQRGDRNVQYRVSDMAAEAQKGRQYGMLLSRGVVISHIPRIRVYDFLADATRLTTDNGYFLFDFMQDVNRGDENERPVGPKNEFTIEQMDGIMKELGWNKVADDGEDDYRVRVVCYKKLGKNNFAEQAAG